MNQKLVLKVKRNTIISIGILEGLCLAFHIQHATVPIIAVKCLVMTFSFVYVILPKAQLKQLVLSLMAGLLYEQSFMYDNELISHAFQLCWLFSLSKCLKDIKLRIVLALHFVVSISVKIAMKWSSDEFENYFLIIWLGALICHLVTYEWKAASRRKLEIEETRPEMLEQPSQKLFREYHRAMSSRRSVMDSYKVNQDFFILDFLPIGVIIFNKNQEFQFMNEKSKQQIEAIVGSLPQDEEVLGTINRILKQALSKQSISPKPTGMRTQKNKLSRIISSLRAIEDHESGIQTGEKNPNLNQSDYIKSFLSKDRQSQQDTKNIVQFTQHGKKKFVKFMFHTQDPTGLLIILIIDITQKVAHQSQQIKHNFQHQLLNSFSHELRTPLNCTQQILESLKFKLHYDVVEHYIQPIIFQNELLLCQLNDILDYAAIEIGNFELNTKVLDINRIFKRCQSIFNSACIQKRLNLVIDIEGLLALKNDPQRIMQVLVNLLNNAVKFTEVGGTIKLQARVVHLEHLRMVKLKVVDNGMGMHEEQVAALQYMAENQGEECAIYTHYFGLGLKVASKLVVSFNKLGTSLQIKSAWGKGTKVSFFVSDFEETMMEEESECEFQVSRHYASMTTAEFKFMRAVNCRCKKILLVDDVPFNHMALQLLLQELNHHADSAFDGEQAVKMVRERMNVNDCHANYQLILMDIEMPRMNGFDASMNIKQVLGEQAQNTCIVMCSAYDSLECRKMAKRCQMDDFLPKPITKNNLLQILQNYVK